MSKAHVIDIVVQTHDKVSQGLDSAQRKLNNFDRVIDRTKARLNNMTKSEYSLVLKAIDRVTPETSKVGRALRSLTQRSYNITLRALDRASESIRGIHARLTSLTSRAWNATVGVKNNLAGKASNAMQSVTGFSGQMMAGAGMAYGLYDTVNTYKNFQAQMSTVASITGASSEEMAILTAKAKEMGATTSFSASEAGKAFEYMAMAGWKAGQMTEGIAGIMNLAAASGEELGTVSDIVTDALTAFGLKAEDAGHFADVLAQTASNANTNVGMLGYSFKYVAPLAGSLKYSVEDVNLALGLMANAGLKGEQSGSQLRNVISNLISPSKTVAAGMDRLSEALGREFNMVDQATGKMRPFKAVINDLRQAMAHMTEEEKAETASMIAGQTSMSGLLAIVNASTEDFNKMSDAINNADGAAERMAKVKMDNLAGDLKLLASAWESFQLEIMEGTGGGNFLRDIVQGVQKDVERLVGYMKDGFGITDMARLLLDIVVQLKDKFMALDGVGSILAGGALAGGLIKIGKLGAKAIESVTGAMGGKGGSNLGGLPSPSDMAINANTVIVNGKNIGGNGGVGGTPTGSGASGGAKAKGRFAGKLGGGVLAGVMSALMGAYDVYDTRERNGVLSQEAQYGVDKASEVYRYKKEHGMDTTQAGNELFYAYQYQDEVNKANANRENGAIGGAIGGAVGGIAGGAIGSVFGPVGTMIGGMIGASIGDSIGTYLGENGEDILNSFNEAVRGVCDSITATAEDAGGAVRSFFENVGTGIGAAVDETIQQASEMCSSLGQAFDDAWTWVNSVWGETASWFDSAVWQPLTSSVSSTYSSIIDAFSSALNTVKGIWAEAASWFESTVINPIKEKFTAMKNLGADLIGVGGGSETRRAYGGFVFSPQHTLIGESGPEVVIPLGAGTRDRAFDLLDRTATMLGVNEAPQSVLSDENMVPNINTQAGSNLASISVSVDIGGISPSFVIEGGGNADSSSIMTHISENMNVIADMVASKIAEQVGAICNNSPLRA